MNPAPVKPPLQRPALSFGFKLTLAMVMIIAGVCVSAMLILRGQIERNYSEFLSRNFERQVSMFFENQESMLNNARKVLHGATGKGVRLIAALDPTDMHVDHLYADLDFQLEGLRRSGSNIIFRVFDADGHYLTPPADESEVAVPGISEEQLAGAFSPLMQAAKANPDSTESPVSYAVLGAEDHLQVYQMTTMPFVDPAENEVLCYIVFGVELDAQASFGPGTEGQKSGYLLDDHRLISNSLPSTVVQPLAQLISSRKLDVHGEEFTLKGTGGRYLLFTRRLGSDKFPSSITLYPLSELEGLTKEINWVMISIIPVSLLVCLILAAFVSRRFTRPILDLVQGTEAVGRGDFSTRVAVRSRDEVGCLSAAFNEMSAELAQKEKYRNVLDRVTDREVAERLLSGELSLGGELREASILFCDIRGFTSLTERMDPVEVIELLNLHMTALTDVVHRHHGVVDKFVGDALMAIFAPRKVMVPTPWTLRNAHWTSWRSASGSIPSAATLFRLASAWRLAWWSQVVRVR